MHLSKTSWLQEEYVVPELLHFMVDRKEEKGRGVTQTETDRQEGRNKTQPQGQAPSVLLPPAALPPTVSRLPVGREPLAHEPAGMFPTGLPLIQKG